MIPAWMRTKRSGLLFEEFRRTQAEILSWDTPVMPSMHFFYNKDYQVQHVGILSHLVTMSVLLGATALALPKRPFCFSMVLSIMPYLQLIQLGK